MQQQLNFKTGEQLRNEGINQAITHANEIFENWSDHAYNFLKKFMESNSEFMVEDVRLASIGKIPQPPSNKAWGGIVVRAKGNNLIETMGTSPVKNHLAHCANAAVWKRIEKKILPEW